MFKVMKEKKRKNKTNKKTLNTHQGCHSDLKVRQSVKPTQKISVALSQLYKKY